MVSDARPPAAYGDLVEAAGRQLDLPRDRRLDGQPHHGPHEADVGGPRRALVAEGAPCREPFGGSGEGLVRPERGAGGGGRGGRRLGGLGGGGGRSTRGLVATHAGQRRAGPDPQPDDDQPGEEADPVPAQAGEVPGDADLAGRGARRAQPRRAEARAGRLRARAPAGTERGRQRQGQLWRAGERPRAGRRRPGSRSGRAAEGPARTVVRPATAAGRRAGERPRAGRRRPGGRSGGAAVGPARTVVRPATAPGRRAGDPVTPLSGRERAGRERARAGGARHRGRAPRRRCPRAHPRGRPPRPPAGRSGGWSPRRYGRPRPRRRPRPRPRRRAVGAPAYQRGPTRGRLGRGGGRRLGVSRWLEGRGQRRHQGGDRRSRSVGDLAAIRRDRRSRPRGTGERGLGVDGRRATPLPPCGGRSRRRRARERGQRRELPRASSQAAAVLIPHRGPR